MHLNVMSWWKTLSCVVAKGTDQQFRGKGRESSLCSIINTNKER